MSLPSFPNSENMPTREEVINQIISSIAMEELGLSHIINAEGEKIQYALGTIPEVPGLEEPLTIEDLLNLNDSVRKTLNSTMMNQFFLREKLVDALSASVMQGPTGPTGPQGPATIDVAAETENLEPGEPPYVVNDGTPVDVMLRFGIPRGATGAAGTVEVSAMQAVLDNAGGAEVEILQGGVIPFNQVLSSSGTDISYDTAANIFTINTNGLNNIYMINWWVFVEGSDSTDPVSFALNVGAVPYVIEMPWVERQLSGSTLAVAGDNPIQVTLTNASGSAVSLSNVSVQAQITIIGFRGAN